MSKFRNEVNCILNSIKRGDKSQRQVLCELTYNHLKVIAIKYAYKKDEYEDILLESYLRIFKYVSTVDSTKDGYNWMCKIVQNVAYDFNKSKENYICFEEIGIEDTEIIWEIVDDKSMLYEAIAKLSSDDQLLLYLRFWEDMSYSQIAKKLNKRKSSVHKRISVLVRGILKEIKM